MLQVADAVEYAHANGVLHRDIKPSNLMADPTSGRVWVVDFGLAKVRESSQPTLTTGGIGTAAYSSPEQLAGKGFDERSDIYSFGATFKRLLSRLDDQRHL